MRAFKKGYSDLVACLQATNAIDYTLKDKAGNTALWYAINTKDLGVVNHLIKEGAIPTWEDTITATQNPYIATRIIFILRNMPRILR